MFGSGFPSPEEAKAQAMPLEHGLGLDEEQGLSPVGPEAQQAHPKQAVGEPEFWFGWLPLEHGELMSERQVFEDQFRAAAKGGKQDTNKGGKELEHRSTSLFWCNRKSSC